MEILVNKPISVFLVCTLVLSLIGCSWQPSIEAKMPFFSHSDPKEPNRIDFKPVGPTQWPSVVPVSPSVSKVEPTPAQISGLTILFPVDIAVVQPDDRARIQQWVNRLPSLQQGHLTISGHTDSVMSEDYNQKLSVRRANAVAELLQSMGLNGDQIHLEAHGKRLPQANNQDDSGRALNRRVVLEWLRS